MNILIIDRNELQAQMLAGKIESLGHRVRVEAVKNDAIESLGRSERTQVVFLDPSPLTNARPLIQNIRRSLGSYVYIILVEGDDTSGSGHEATSSGANMLVSKPYDIEMIEPILGSAGRMLNKVNNLSDDSIDFPSAGGIIAKSAFNQLFLSAIDRANRYGESSYAVFFDISNYLDLLEKDGQYYADFAVAKMSQQLSIMRRQSDILGQTARNEYSLLLQRPHYETEPVDAVNRFAEELSKLKTTRDTVESDPEISLKLIELPTGTKVVEHHITLRG